MNEKRVKVSVRLPEETKRKALALADHLGISLNAVIALAVRHYITTVGGVPQ